MLVAASPYSSLAERLLADRTRGRHHYIARHLSENYPDEESLFPGDYHRCHKSNGKRGGARPDKWKGESSSHTSPFTTGPAGYGIHVTGARNILIEKNRITGPIQGITDFGTTGQPPVTNVIIRNNTVAVSTYHGITLWNATNSRITGNEVRGTTPFRITQIHWKGDVTACGNTVWDRPKSPANTPCRR